MAPPKIRRRLPLGLAILSVIAVGLASRAIPSLFPASLGKYPGDALWAAMVFFGIAFVRPGMAPPGLAALALLVSYAVEVSQLYQAAWITTVRSYRLGHLVLGSGFDRMDLVAYAVGVLVAFVFDIGFLIRSPGGDSTND